MACPAALRCAPRLHTPDQPYIAPHGALKYMHALHACMYAGRGAVYGGHLGGAVPYPWRQVFDADGNLRPQATIRSELEELGYQPGQRMVVYCTRGVRASFAVVAFVSAGFEVTLYEGMLPTLSLRRA
jgi:thiosulfate/3-mercaptopyruvate sulfurtransferase